MLDGNYGARRLSYSTAMKEMFKTIPMTKPLSPGQKLQKLITEIGGGWYMEKLLRDYHY